MRWRARRRAHLAGVVALCGSTATVGACGGDPPGAGGPAAAPAVARAGAAAATAPALVDPPASWAGSAAAVIYGATRDGRTDLYLTGPDGAERKVVDGPSSEVQPRPAPDGRQVVFHARSGDAPYGLFRATPTAPGVSADAGAPGPSVTVEPLAVEDGVHALGGVWSPDGASLAYFSTRGEAPPAEGTLPGHIWLRELATGADRRITREPLPGPLGPSGWWPDGGSVLAARPFDGQLDLVRIDVATGTEIRLTDDPTGEYGATVSHDGRRVAFHAETDDSAQIVVLDLATGGRRALTAGPGWRYGPVWSPDDAWLLITASGPAGEQYDVVALRVADGAEVPVAATDDDERYGAWVVRGSPWVVR